jgi:hypothetical protein
MRVRVIVTVPLLAMVLALASLRTVCTPVFGAVWLADGEMAYVGGGNQPSGMCASRRDCLDSSKTCQGEGAACAYKGGPGQEDYCGDSYTIPPQFCALDTDQEANCGTWYRDGKCMGGICQGAQNSYEVADANKRTATSNDCSK